MKEGEPSRTVDKSCITDPTPHNRLPVQPDSTLIYTRNATAQFCASAQVMFGQCISAQLLWPKENKVFSRFVLRT